MLRGQYNVFENVSYLIEHMIDSVFMIKGGGGLDVFRDGYGRFSVVLVAEHGKNLEKHIEAVKRCFERVLVGVLAPKGYRLEGMFS